MVNTDLVERPRFELPSSSLFVDPEPGLIFREEYEDYTREVWAGDFPRDNLNLPNNDSELTLATSPSSNQLHTISVDPKAVLPFKTRGHCGEVDCVGCNREPCGSCYNCLHKSEVK